MDWTLQQLHRDRSLGSSRGAIPVRSVLTIHMHRFACSSGSLCVSRVCYPDDDRCTLFNRKRFCEIHMNQSFYVAREMN